MLFLFSGSRPVLPVPGESLEGSRRATLLRTATKVIICNYPEPRLPAQPGRHPSNQFPFSAVASLPALTNNDKWSTASTWMEQQASAGGIITHLPDEIGRAVFLSCLPGSWAARSGGVQRRGEGPRCSRRADPGGDASASDVLGVPKAGTSPAWPGRGSPASSEDNVALLGSK